MTASEALQELIDQIVEERVVERTKELQAQLQEQQDELKKARDLNTKLHRRVQLVEAPFVSLDTQLDLQRKHICDNVRWDHKRCSQILNEVLRFFHQINRAYQYPGGGRSVSCRDEKEGDHRVIKLGFFYNDEDFRSRRTPESEDILMLDELTKLVDELLTLRYRTQTNNSDGYDQTAELNTLLETAKYYIGLLIFYHKSAKTSFCDTIQFRECVDFIAGKVQKNA